MTKYNPPSTNQFLQGTGVGRVGLREKVQCLLDAYTESSHGGLKLKANL